MRRYRIRTAIAPCLAIAAWTIPASAQQQQYDIPKILQSYRPVQNWVDYDSPATPDEVKACTVEVVSRTETNAGKTEKKAIGILIRDGRGRVLRRFLDTAEPKGTDQWSYYQDGFEVYREVDFNGDQKVDEARWLNLAGTRIGTIKAGRIGGWRRISAEEASKVLVQGLVSSDLELINSVIATPEELAELGLPAGLVEQARREVTTRKADAQTLSDKLTGWTKQTVWMRFDGIQPHVIPSDALNGLQEDVELYENAVVFAGPSEGQADLNALAYLQAPEMVRVGQNWKFVGLPRVFDPKNPDAAMAAFDGVRSWVYREAGSVVTEGSASPELEKALTALSELDQKWVGQLENADPKAVAKYHYDRVQLLREVVKAAGADDRLAYEKEIVNSLAAAYQTGEYPDGMKAIDRLVEAGGVLGSYAAYRKIPATYTLIAKDPDKVAEAQKAWVADLETFLGKYKDAPEVPEALFQLATIQELNGNDEGAKASYERISKDYANSEPAAKARGALHRLALVGQPLQLAGTSPDGSPVDLAAQKGKMVLVVFGASVAEPFRRELPELVRLRERYKDKGFEVLGVALDPQKESWTDFVSRSQIPWPTIYEPGGMESRLANEFGIISYYYPTMILVDRDGKVVDRDLRTSLEVEQAIEKPLAQKPE